MDTEGLAGRLRVFAQTRDWEKFHTPKNLVMALCGEAGELAEQFQWLTSEEAENAMEDPAKAEAIRDEMADVLGYLIRLADILEVDLETALENKIAKNEKKYPVELARGNAKKYTEFDNQ